MDTWIVSVSPHRDDDIEVEANSNKTNDLNGIVSFYKNGTGPPIAEFRLATIIGWRKKG
jgi:hypothetical protein